MVSRIRRCRMRPSDYHPDLTDKRLIRVAQLLARGRGDALDRYDPDVGDDSWTRGVCAFNYGRHQVRRAAGTPGFEWLSVPDPRRRLVFQIGSLMLRFYRGTAESPNSNMLIATELEQYTLPLEADVSLTDIKFRIAVDTDRDGSVIQIVFVAIRGAQPETIWAIPFETAPPLLVDVSIVMPEAIELSPAEVFFEEDDDDIFKGDTNASDK